MLPPLMQTALAVATLGLGGCTYIVVDDALHTPAPCAKVGDCASGFACVDNVCEAVPDSVTPPPAGLLVTSAGGAVTGVDDVTVTLAAGAVTDDLRVLIATASATHVPVGFVEQSPFYELGPDVEVESATIAIPVDGGCTQCKVIMKPDDDGAPWIPLEGGPASSGKVEGALVSFAGVYAVGLAVNP